jgi:hypothetical protein
MPPLIASDCLTKPADSRAVEPPYAESTTRRASTCRWAVPTVCLPAPLWCAAEACPWTCVHSDAPHVMNTTEPCAICVNWESKRAAWPAPVACPDDAGPLMVDWFGAFPPPHEVA